MVWVRIIANVLLSGLLFLGLELLVYRVVRRVTVSNCKGVVNNLLVKRKQLIKYIRYFLLLSWVFYLGYLFRSDISWVGDVSTNLITAACVTFLQELEQMDDKGVSLQIYVLIGIALLCGWVAIVLSGIDKSSNDVITFFEKIAVPFGAGLIVWGANERFKCWARMRSCNTRRLK